MRPCHDKASKFPICHPMENVLSVKVGTQLHYTFFCSILKPRYIDNLDKIQWGKCRLQGTRSPVSKVTSSYKVTGALAMHKYK